MPLSPTSHQQSEAVSDGRYSDRSFGHRLDRRVNAGEDSRNLGAKQQQNRDYDDRDKKDDQGIFNKTLP